MKLRSLSILTLALFALAGCDEGEGPIGPGRDAPGSTVPPLTNTLVCDVSVQTGEMTCTDPAAGAAGSASEAILGDQGTYVYLESSAVSYDSTTETFRASVAIRNFLTQPLGTTDGVTGDPAGIRIFFTDAPQVVLGSGAITVSNADGTDNFTGSNQPYHRYNGPVEPGMRSGTKFWEWNVPTTVQAFSFKVGVSAALPDEGNVEPATPLVASSVVTGNLHTCALDTEGRAWCWGENENGQLGDGTTTPRTTPTPVAGDLRFISLAAALVHTCGVTTDSTAYCWGNAQYGRIGNGSSGAANNITTPTRISGDLKIKMISNASSNTCAVTVDGVGYCWGFGTTGRVGNGELVHQLEPVQVSGGHVFTEIQSAHHHTCGLTTDGKAWCWGNPSLGRLGHGSTTGDYADVPVPVDQGDLVFTSMSASTSSSCALTVDGDAWCWGHNGEVSTRLGNGTVDEAIPYPVPVLGGHKFIEVTVGDFHACGLTAEGNAWCWGRGLNGRRGDGVTAEENALEPVPVGGNLLFKTINTKKDHTCGVTFEGKVYCWGLNGTSQRLGVGNSNTNIPLPRLISPITAP